MITKKGMKNWNKASIIAVFLSLLSFEISSLLQNSQKYFFP